MGTDTWADVNEDTVVVHAEKEFTLSSDSILGHNSHGENLNPTTSVLAQSPSLYTLADFCAGKQFPSSLKAGWGIGNVRELEARREELCAQREENGVSLDDIMQAVHDQASQIIDSGKVIVQPSAGTILVNKDVFYFSTASEHVSAVKVAGENIPLRLTPVSFRWDFGDGNELSTQSPGGKWPDGDVVHAYQKSGRYTPRLDIFWKVDVRLPKAPWLQLPNLGHTQAIGEELDLVEAKTVLTYRSR